MGNRLSGYSLLEIILVTTMLIIFIIVINPGTYIDHFSKILFKMNVLNESELLINKMNAYALNDCTVQSISNTNVRFVTLEEDLSLSISNSFSVVNHQTSFDATLFANIDPGLSLGFSFYDVYFNQTLTPEDVHYMEFNVASSLLDYDVNGPFICRDYSIVLGAF